MGKQTFIKVLKVPPGLIKVMFTEDLVLRVTLRSYGDYTQSVTESAPEPGFFLLLRRYLKGEVVDLGSIPVSYERLPYRYIKVYEYMREHLLYGTTTTYGQLANILNIHPRKVGLILSKNPIPILVPCHRVLAKGGLGGYSSGLRWKKFLLTLEGILKDIGSLD